MNQVKGFENLSPLEREVLEQVETVIDPELGIDIVNLGLVYGIDVDEEKNAKVTMTLTTMGCPLYDTIHNDIQQAVSQVQEINDIHVNLIWYPAWTPDKMSRYARIALGIPSIS